jgi:hypothetical protein
MAPRPPCNHRNPACTFAVTFAIVVAYEKLASPVWWTEPFRNCFIISTGRSHGHRSGDNPEKIIPAIRTTVSEDETNVLTHGHSDQIAALLKSRKPPRQTRYSLCDSDFLEDTAVQFAVRDFLVHPNADHSSNTVIGDTRSREFTVIHTPVIRRSVNVCSVKTSSFPGHPRETRIAPRDARRKPETVNREYPYRLCWRARTPQGISRTRT